MHASLEQKCCEIMLVLVCDMDENADSVASITCSTLIPMLVIGMLMCYWHRSGMFSEGTTRSHDKEAHSVMPKTIETILIHT